MSIGKHEKPNKGETDIWLTPHSGNQSATMVVTERKLVQVSLQILWRNSVESPMNRPFELRPETLNRVGVNVALDGFVEMPDRPNLVVKG